jgi:uncharacterized damage-inducible protein DinB
VTRRLSLLIAGLAVPIGMFAQEAPSAPANPISNSEKGMYIMLSGMVVAGAEKMPEANYSFRPTPDVRNFGQLVGHLADAQYFFCATAAGEAPPAGAGAIEKTKTSKADIIAALKDAIGYCTKVYSAMTDTKGSEMTKFENFTLARMTILSANTAHDYEHYGNMVTYMRLKGIVPPSSEKSASASAGGSK